MEAVYIRSCVLAHNYKKKHKGNHQHGLREVRGNSCRDLDLSSTMLSLYLYL